MKLMGDRVEGGSDENAAAAADDDDAGDCDGGDGKGIGIGSDDQWLIERYWK